jgi:hypothetical protein
VAASIYRALSRWICLVIQTGSPFLFLKVYEPKELHMIKKHPLPLLHEQVVKVQKLLDSAYHVATQFTTHLHVMDTLVLRMDLLAMV